MNQQTRVAQVLEGPERAELLALLLQREGVSTAPTIRIIPDPSRETEPFPLTDIQQVYYIGRSSNFDLGGIAAHGYSERDIPGLDIRRLERAFQKAIDRHAMLRAIIQPDGKQRILKEVPNYQIATQDLQALQGDFLDAELNRTRAALSHQVVDVTRWPLFEVRASLLPHQMIRLHLSIDILIFDAWSLRVLYRDIYRYYWQEDIQLPALELSFRDYVLAEHRLKEMPAYKVAWDYWRPRLPNLAAPDLPLAVSLSSINRPRFERLSGHLNPLLWQRLKTEASHRGLTPSGVLLAAFSDVIATFSSSVHFTINLTLFNRRPLHPQVDEIVGDFTSITLLEVDQMEASFELRARKLQTRLWQDIEHNAVSGVELLRELNRLREGTILMPVVFTSLLGMPTFREQADGDKATRKINPRGGAAYGISQTPQVILDHQVAELQEALHFNWDILAEAFPQGFVEAMFGSYCDLLDRLATTDAAWRATTVSLLPVDQLKLFEEANMTAGLIPKGTLHGAFLERAFLQPSAPAVITPAVTLTYGDLESRSDVIAAHIQRQGIKGNHLVAIVMDRGWEQVVAVLGVLRAGAAYLPVDPSSPKMRLNHLLEEGGVELVLTQSWLETSIAWPEQVRTIAVDQQGQRLDGEKRPTVAVGSEDLAYVIYTSGSTGRPKGVMIDHRGALNTILDVNRRFSVGAQDRCLAISSLSFDLSVYDIFGPLAAGGSILMPRPSEVPDPSHWLEFCIQHRVTIWNSVPALANLVVEESVGWPEGSLSTLRLALLSGDWIPLTLPDRLKALAPNVQTISLGGATEVSIWSIFKHVQTILPQWSSIPYGRALTNQRFHVLNEMMEPSPVWVPGYLYIGGAGLAIGYWHDAARTSMAFVPHPITGERLYRTGDLGRWLPDGEIEFLGRRDSQVKIRGYRIELGEIEAKLLEHPSVKQAAVSAIGDRHGTKKLAAYVVMYDAVEIDFHQFLSDSLPAYMIPAHFVSLPSLPLTPNGKIDRKALPAPEGAPAKADFVAARTPLEKILADIWQEALALTQQVGIHDNFFELGGDSLLGTRMVVRLQQALNITLPLKLLFERSTIADLVDLGSTANVTRTSKQATNGSESIQFHLRLLAEATSDSDLSNRVHMLRWARQKDDHSEPFSENDHDEGVL